MVVTDATTQPSDRTAPGFMIISTEGIRSSGFQSRRSAPNRSAYHTAAYSIETTAPRIDEKILAQALSATECARSNTPSIEPHVLTVIDYSRPSTELRMWVFDLDHRRLLFEELVAHGRHTVEKTNRFASLTCLAV